MRSGTTSSSPTMVISSFFILVLLVPLVSSISFKINQFESDDPRVIYEGGATPYLGTIEFNSDSYMSQVGRATYAEEIPIWDLQTKRLTDFTTHFSFNIDTRNQATYAAGFAFFLAPVGFQIPPNSAGGFLGLFNLTTAKSPRNQIVLVEFDSFPNPEWDPPFQHVGINRNSVSSAVYTFWNTTLHSADTADAWITYNGATKNLSVSWTYQKTASSIENTSLSYTIDLTEVLPEWVTVGFTAATSNLIERHVLEYWEFSSTLQMKDKRETKETSGNNAKQKRLVVGLSASLGALIGAAIITFGVLRRRKQMRQAAAARAVLNLTSINNDIEKQVGPRRFSSKDLASATNNFSNQRKLGEGGFGTVYRGYLPDLDIVVAVKRISRSSKQGKKEYLTEVKTISQLRHRNLVQLIGWCHDSGEFLLVYEYMPNGSLDSHLFGKKPPLTWPVRYRIAIGLASALLYLQEEWEQCVVHRDVKSSNIMLDSSFNVKLGDFGLARLMDHELGQQTTGLAGTAGYMAPEYIRTCRASKESDIYSFGVVALEIATGRKAIDVITKDCEMSLVEWIWDLYGEGNLKLALDERLQSDIDEKQGECLMIVGLWCAHPDRNMRPSIRQAIHALKFEGTLQNLPASMPIPLYDTPAPPVNPWEAVSTPYSSIQADH